MDTAAIDSAGMKPVDAELARIAAIASTIDSRAALAALHDRESAAFSASGSRPTRRRATSTRSTPTRGMSLPSKATISTEQFEKFRAAFVEHVAKMLTLACDRARAAAGRAKTVFEVREGSRGRRQHPGRAARLARHTTTRCPPRSSPESCRFFPLHATWRSRHARSAPATSSSASRNSSRALLGAARRAAAPGLEGLSALPLLRAAAPYLARALSRRLPLLQHRPARHARDGAALQRSARVIDARSANAGRLYVERYYPPRPRRAWNR